MNILGTPRLLLRWAIPTDAACLLALVNDPDWHRHVNNPGVASEAQALAWMESRLLAPCRRHGHGFWVMEERASGQPIGICGIHQRDSLPVPDLGYGLLPAWRGEGLVQEAARACVAYAREVLGLTRLMGITDAGYAASARVLTAAGLRRVDSRPLVGAGELRPTDIYEIRWPAPADDAQAIDALIARLHRAHDNRGPQPHRLAALPCYFTPEAGISTVDAEGAVRSTDLWDHIGPHAELLAPGGRLSGWHIWAEASSGWQQGPLAQRRVRVVEAGQLDGRPAERRSTQAFQLLRQDGRWRIAALAWQDAA